INGQPPLSCEIGEDVALDSQGRLYVNAPGNHRLYRIDPEKQCIELLSDLRIRQSNVDPSIYYPPDTPLLIPYLNGPANLYLDQSQVYFAMSALTVNLEETISR